MSDQCVSTKRAHWPNALTNVFPVIKAVEINPWMGWLRHRSGTIIFRSIHIKILLMKIWRKKRKQFRKWCFNLFLAILCSPYRLYQKWFFIFGAAIFLIECDLVQNTKAKNCTLCYFEQITTLFIKSRLIFQYGCTRKSLHLVKSLWGIKEQNCSLLVDGISPYSLSVCCSFWRLPLIPHFLLFSMHVEEKIKRSRHFNEWQFSCCRKVYAYIIQIWVILTRNVFNEISIWKRECASVRLQVLRLECW